MNDGKTKVINENIFPVTTIFNILGFVGTILTIYFAATKFEGLSRIIAILVLFIIILAVLLAKVWVRLKKVIGQYNSQIIDLNDANDNRDTLKKMINDKNDEIDKMKHEIPKLNAKVELLVYFLELAEKPNMQTVEQALKINQGEVIDDEE